MRLEAKVKDLPFEAQDFKMCSRGQGRPRRLHLCLLQYYCSFLELLQKH